MLNGYSESHAISAYGPAVLRLVVGLVFVAHGAQKLFGVWGGRGLPGTATYLAELGFEPSYALAVVAATIEFGGGLLLIVGAYTVVAALALSLQMLAVIWMVHLPHGFFVSNNGYEFNLTLIGALVCLALTGPGVFSIDTRRASHAATAAAGRARLRAGKV